MFLSAVMNIPLDQTNNCSEEELYDLVRSQLVEDLCSQLRDKKIWLTIEETTCLYKDEEGPDHFPHKEYKVMIKLM
jgi:hypothetical protein